MCMSSAKMFSIGARSGDKDGQSRKLVSYNVSVVIRFSVCALAFSCW